MEHASYEGLDSSSRIGPEYQAEIPSVIKKSEQFSLQTNLADSLAAHDKSLSFAIGLPIPVTWIHNEMEDSGHEEWGYRRDINSCQLVPDRLSCSWSDADTKSFLLGLFIFGKNFIQIKKFLDNKGMGEILSFYYGKFYKTDGYRRWSECRKKKGRKCMIGRKLFTGPRQHELLSRLIPHVSEESQDTLLQVSRSYVEGTTSLEEYISSLKSTVGLGVLVEAVGIGKEEGDLTRLGVEPAKNSRAVKAPTCKALSSLEPSDIIQYLTGGFRLSKTKSNELFWEAIWPRLLARGWHSEQPKYRDYVTSKDYLVFLIPGVEKFSGRKLVKGDHYFDSVSDVLRKVVAEPNILELEEAAAAKVGSFNEEEPEKGPNEDDLSDDHCQFYLKPRSSTYKKDRTKFMAIDTILVHGGKPSDLRKLKPVPVNAVGTVEVDAAGKKYKGQKYIRKVNQKNQQTYVFDDDDRLKRIAKHQFNRRVRSGDSTHAVVPIKRRRLTDCTKSEKSRIIENSSGAIPIPTASTKSTAGGSKTSEASKGSKRPSVSTKENKLVKKAKKSKSVVVLSDSNDESSSQSDKSPKKGKVSTETTETKKSNVTEKVLTRIKSTAKRPKSKGDPSETQSDEDTAIDLEGDTSMPSNEVPIGQPTTAEPSLGVEIPTSGEPSNQKKEIKEEEEPTHTTTGTASGKIISSANSCLGGQAQGGVASIGLEFIVDSTLQQKEPIMEKELQTVEVPNVQSAPGNVDVIPPIQIEAETQPREDPQSDANGENQDEGVSHGNQASSSSKDKMVDLGEESSSSSQGNRHESTSIPIATSISSLFANVGLSTEEFKAIAASKLLCEKKSTSASTTSTTSESDPHSTDNEYSLLLKLKQQFVEGNLMESLEANPNLIYSLQRLLVKFTHTKVNEMLRFVTEVGPLLNAYVKNVLKKKDVGHKLQTQEEGHATVLGTIFEDKATVDELGNELQDGNTMLKTSNDRITKYKTEIKRLEVEIKRREGLVNVEEAKEKEYLDKTTSLKAKADERARLGIQHICQAMTMKNEIQGLKETKSTLQSEIDSAKDEYNRLKSMLNLKL